MRNNQPGFPVMHHSLPGLAPLIPPNHCIKYYSCLSPGSSIMKAAAKFLWNNSGWLAARFFHYFNLCILARTAVLLLFSTNISLKLRETRSPVQPGGRGGLSFVPVATPKGGLYITL